METGEIFVAIQEAAKTVATPNWADKLSIVVSLIAVVVAGFVAWKQIGITKEQMKIANKQADISKEQNKISLLEKRIEVFELAILAKTVAKEIIESANNNIESCRIFVRHFNEFPAMAGNLLTNENQLNPQQTKLILMKISNAEFIFSEEIRIHMVALASHLFGVMKLNNEEEFLAYKDLLNQIIIAIEENKIMEKMENELLPKVEVE